MKPIAACFSLLTVVVAASIAAAATPATTGPASSGAGVPAPDYSTPENTLRTFLIANKAGNAPVVVDAIAWDDPADAKTFSVVASVQWKNTAAAKAAVAELLAQTFPDDPDVKALMATLAAADASMAKLLPTFNKMIAESEVKVDGTDATIAPKTPLVTLRFKKIGDRWQMLAESAPALDSKYKNVIDFGRDERNSVGAITTPEQRKPMEDYLQLHGRIMELTAAGLEKFKADLKAKKFATGKEALAAYGEIATEAAKQAGQ